MNPSKPRRISVIVLGLMMAASAGLRPGPAWSQEPAAPPEAPAPSLPAGVPATSSPSPVVMPDFAAVGQPDVFAAPIAPQVELSTREVIRESIFGAADPKDWKPLSLRGFFTEGWKDPYVNAPEGTNGAPKQNILGAPAGVFGRFATVDFFYTNHLNNVLGAFLTPNAPFMPVHPLTNGNSYAGYTSILIPLNARFELFVGTVFIASNKTSPGGGYTGNWGDTGVQARFHLIDNRNFSLIAFLGERIPTGKSVNGNDINYITPAFEFWWNFAPQWTLRGGSQINILTGRKTSASIYVNQLSLGRYLTTKDANVFKELEVHLTVSVLSDISGGIGFLDDIYINPGFRFGLDKTQKWYALGGVNVPVSGPQAYAWQPQFEITRNY